MLARFIFCFLCVRMITAEVESRTQGSRPRPQKKSEAKAKDSSSRGQGQECSRRSPKKNVFQKIFASARARVETNFVNNLPDGQVITIVCLPEETSTCPKKIDTISFEVVYLCQKMVYCTSWQKNTKFAEYAFQNQVFVRDFTFM